MPVCGVTVYKFVNKMSYFLNKNEKNIVMNMIPLIKTYICAQKTIGLQKCLIWQVKATS